MMSGTGLPVWTQGPPHSALPTSHYPHDSAYTYPAHTGLWGEFHPSKPHIIVKWGKYSGQGFANILAAEKKKLVKFVQQLADSHDVYHYDLVVSSANSECLRSPYLQWFMLISRTTRVVMVLSPEEYAKVMGRAKLDAERSSIETEEHLEGALLARESSNFPLAALIKLPLDHPAKWTERHR
jgi:hypothetical protein